MLVLLSAAAHAAEGAPHAVPWRDLAFHALNLLLLLAVLAWLLRRPVRDALAGRRHRIETEIVRAREIREEAERRHAEIQARLEAFEEQVAALERQAREAAGREADLIRRRTDQDIESLQAAARRTIREELQAARQALREDAVDLAIRIAREDIVARIGPDDERRLAEELLEAVRKEAHHG